MTCEPKFQRSGSRPPPESHALHPAPDGDGDTDELESVALRIKAALHGADGRSAAAQRASRTLSVPVHNLRS